MIAKRLRRRTSPPLRDCLGCSRAARRGPLALAQHLRDMHPEFVLVWEINRG